VSVAVAAAAAGLTWRRLFFGMDLQDEGFSILVPWRWVLGHAPYSEVKDVFQIPALLEYPFLKLFGLVRGNDPTGLVLYTRHLYLLLMVGVAVVVFLLLRRLVRWELALLVASLCVTFIPWATPQLSYNTMALAFLTLSAALGASVVVVGGRRRLAVASGAALGLAVVAYPSLLFITPFWAVLLAFAHGTRTTTLLATGRLGHDAQRSAPETGRSAWRTVSGWTLGGLLVLVPVGLLSLSYGPHVLAASVRSTMEGAKASHQLGGAAKAIAVVGGYERLIAWRPSLLVGALVIYLVYRRWPLVGRALLLTTPVALWLAAQRPELWASGYVIIFAFLAPWLFLFVPAARRRPGAQLLVCVWAPSMIAGAMTAYTSAAGYVSSAVGFAPSVFVSGLFLAWALEALRDPGVPGAESARGGTRRPWPALVGLVALVAVTLAFQYQFQERNVPYGELTRRMTSGPWWGIAVTPSRAALMTSIQTDVAREARKGDSLLIEYQAPGLYLSWNGPIASTTYWLSPGPDEALPAGTVAFYRKTDSVPSLVVRLTSTAGQDETALAQDTGGLDYPPVVVRPWYFLARKPAGDGTQEVLARLPQP